MEKDFDKWCPLKKEINSQNNLIQQFNEREIWWTSIGVNIGFEQDGKYDQFHRPVLILKKFNKEMFFGVPLTSKIREGIFYSNFEYLKKDETDKSNSTALLSQMRLFSSKRLIRRIVKLNTKTFNSVKNDFINLIQ